MLIIAITVTALLAYAVGFVTSRRFWQDRILYAVAMRALRRLAQDK